MPADQAGPIRPVDLAAGGRPPATLVRPHVPALGRRLSDVRPAWPGCAVASASPSTVPGTLRTSSPHVLPRVATEPHVSNQLSDGPLACPFHEWVRRLAFEFARCL